MTRRRGFTLLEMLLATVLAALLMAAVLAMLVGVSRDRRRLTAATNTPRPQALIEQFRRDLINARTITRSRDGRSIVLVGQGAIDRQSLSCNNRYVRVSYRQIQDNRTPCLIREQEYLDNPARSERWSELVAVGVTSFRIIPESADAWPVADQAEMNAGTTTIASRVRLHIDMTSAAVDEELWIK
jgi:prepilin-type N-terminal cleavage/methylation domain-containing protein